MDSQKHQAPKVHNVKRIFLIMDSQKHQAPKVHSVKSTLGHEQPETPDPKGAQCKHSTELQMARNTRPYGCTM